MNAQQKLIPKALFTVSALILAVALYAQLLAPKPAVAKNAAKQLQAETNIRLDTRHAQDAEAKDLKALEPYLWSEPTDTISSKTLAAVNRLVEASKLKILAFRPQKESSVGTLNAIPYLVNVEGAFPKVTEFVRALEKDGPKLAVQSVQVNSADPASDKVNLTCIVLAIKKPEGLK